MNILVAYKKSTFDFYRVSPDAEVRAFMASNHPRAAMHRQDHEENARNLEATVAALEHAGVTYEMVHRAAMGCAAGKDLVIAVGGDGTFLDAAHHIDSSIPILGVNSTPSTSDSVLLPYRAHELATVLDRLDLQPHHYLRRRQLTINGIETGPPVLNEILYADLNPGATTNGLVRADGLVFEHHNGSGVLASTATGSTAFIWNEDATPLPLTSDRILVHERSRRHASHIEADTVEIESWTRTAHVYLDGSHLSYPAGLRSVVRLEPGAAQLHFIGDLEKQREKYVNAP